ncbi:citrate synthase-lysine N-methyltransferase CSKMT, mitochondrial isoform X2 [Nematostella vectensis]|nr:citrate synthase-lysine N-methyltransferase CSKMT, mitochondrial isoform X2 [Nematostella vectensis]XP_032241824.2 citrate synthase-lysine N-methyltransferase CSKMT, mitochondrial isoform X2 [Nematostella vectensis]
MTMLWRRHLGISTPACMKNTNLSDMSFWEKFYKSRGPNNTFEWFLDFQDVHNSLDKYIHKDSHINILDLGCGTSEFCIQLFYYLRGNCKVAGIDFSEEAIQVMRNLLRQHGLDDSVFSLHVGNVLDLPFSRECFDIIIDKGTADAVLRSPAAETAFCAVLVEACRVLKSEGTILQFSDEPPEVRMDLLTKASQLCHQQNMGHMSFYFQEIGCRSGIERFMYVLQKTGPTGTS